MIHLQKGKKENNQCLGKFAAIIQGCMKTEDVVLGVEILHHDCLNVMMGSIQLILMNLCACSMKILQVCLVLLLLELIQHQQGFAKLK